MAQVVVVQSDILAAWIGLAGVGVGVLLSGGLDWWRSRIAERKATRQQFTVAVDELIGSANALTVAMEGFGIAHRQGGASGTAGDDLIGWVQLMMTQAERLQKASEAIRRLGKPELGQAAAEVASAAMGSVGPNATPGNTQSLAAAVAAFLPLARQHG